MRRDLRGASGVDYTHWWETYETKLTLRSVRLMSWCRTIFKDQAQVANAMSDRRNSNQTNAWRLRLLVLCCCAGIASLGYGENSYRLSGIASSTDRPGVENQLRQLKQALLTLAMDIRLALLQADGRTAMARLVKI